MIIMSFDIALSLVFITLGVSSFLSTYISCANQGNLMDKDDRIYCLQASVKSCTSTRERLTIIHPELTKETPTCSEDCVIL